MNEIFNEDCIKGMHRIKNKSIDLIITDPPYGILPKGKGIDKFKWDNIDLIPFTKEWFNIAYQKLSNDSFMFVFWSQKYFKEGFDIFHPKRVIFWRYNNLINGGGGDFAYDYEPIFVIKKGNPKLIKGKHSCDLEFTKPQSNFKKDKAIHPTQKSLELIKHLINICQKNDIVLDCFMGSGTTAKACIELNKNFIGFEKDEQYYKDTINRLK